MTANVAASRTMQRRHFSSPEICRWRSSSRQQRRRLLLSTSSPSSCKWRCCNPVEAKSSSSLAHPSGICRSFRNQVSPILSLQTSRGGMARLLVIERWQVDGMVRSGISHGHFCVFAFCIVVFPPKMREISRFFTIDGTKVFMMGWGGTNQENEECVYP